MNDEEVKLEEKDKMDDLVYPKAGNKQKETKGKDETDRATDVVNVEDIKVEESIESPKSKLVGEKVNFLKNMDYFEV